MQKRLLYVVNHMDWFWSHRLPLAQGAMESGWEVVVAATGAGREKRLAAYGFQGIELPPATKLPQLLSVCAIVVALGRLLRELKPDLLHVITLKYVLLAGLVARLRPSLPVVFTIAGLGFLFSDESCKARFLRLFIAPFLRLSLGHPQATIIFQNPDDRDQMIRLRFAKPENSVVIRGSGVDIDLFKPTPEPEHGPPMVLMATRLVRDKGVAVFVEAAHLLKAKGVNAAFFIAGGLDYINPNALTKTDMEALTADGLVVWLGKVKDMPALYARSTLVAYPSYYGEGVPKVLLEAAASGRAIVTTEHVGCREVVIDRENGLLVPVKNATALADSINWLLSHGEDRRRMAACGRARAEKEFATERIVKQTLAIYGIRRT